MTRETSFTQRLGDVLQLFHVDGHPLIPPLGFSYRFMAIDIFKKCTRESRNPPEVHAGHNLCHQLFAHEANHVRTEALRVLEELVRNNRANFVPVQEVRVNQGSSGTRMYG